MNTNAVTPCALHHLIRCVKESVFSFDGIPREQWRSVESLIRQHKLRSYIASIADDEVTCVRMARFAEEQNHLRSLSEETCESLAHATASLGLSTIVIKGLSFEKCIYGNRGMRDVGDIDILVLPQDAASLHKALLDMGYRQRTGPASVGAKGSSALAAICASQGGFGQGPSESPVRRHPRKAEYSPYVKPGCPTIEMHDGFYGMPKSYVYSLAVRAKDGEGGFLLDPYANFALLIANTYENSESFYSNAFDYGIVLRDYADLHHFFLAYENVLDWNRVTSLIESLNMSDALAVVLGNYRLIYTEEAYDLGLKHVGSLPSKWGRNILERMGDENLARQAAHALFRKNLKIVAAKRPLTLSTSLATTVKPEYPRNLVVLTCLQISKGDDTLGALWTVPCGALNDTRLFQIGFYPLDGEADYLLLKVDLGIYNGEIRAYAHTTQRYLCGAAVKKKTNRPLPIVVERAGDAVGIFIQISRSDMGLAWGVESQAAVTAEVYERHDGNVFWSTLSEGTELLEDVVIGRVGLLCERGETFSLIAGGYCFTARIDDDTLTARLQSLFGAAHNGWVLPASAKAMRDYRISGSASGVLSFAVDGIEREDGLQRAEAAQLLMQDMTDCLCAQAGGLTFVAHAAAVDFSGYTVLLMGPSGSGKTSLAVGYADAGIFIGDECVFVDVETGCAWCEDFPFQIKEGNDDILATLDLSCALEVNGGAHGKAYYFPRSSVNADIRPRTPKAVRCIAFPKYNAKRRETTIGRLSHADLVRKVLESFVGECPPSNAFREFSRMVSTQRMEIVTIEYSDVADAARALRRHLMGEGK